MPSPLNRAHKALLALLAAMAILSGLIPNTVLDDHGLPPAATATQRRPDDDEEDESDDDTEEEDESEEDSDDTDSDDEDQDDDTSDDDEVDDEVDEDGLPDNVKAILKKERKARRDAERKLKRVQRDAAKPKPKPAPKRKPKEDDDDQDDQPSERERNATQKLQRANLISALSKSKHGLVDPAAAAKLAMQDGLADFDEDDEPTDIDDLVKDLLDEYAFLKAGRPKRNAPNIDSGNGRTKKAPKLTADELRAAKAAGMTPEEYANYQSPQPKLPAKSKPK